jgi:hypothetical protein
MTRAIKWDNYKGTEKKWQLMAVVGVDLAAAKD